MKTTSFKFDGNPTGSNNVTMAHDEAPKNNLGGTTYISSSETLVGKYKRDVVIGGFKVLKVYVFKLNPKLELFF